MVVDGMAAVDGVQAEVDMVMNMVMVVVMVIIIVMAPPTVAFAMVAVMAISRTYQVAAVAAESGIYDRLPSKAPRPASETATPATQMRSSNP
jgi:hypothetical protein